MNKVSKCISIIYRASQKYKTNLNQLFVKQKTFLRIIGKLSSYDHTTPLFLKFNILKLFDLFEHKAACFMYLVYSRKVPEHLQKFYVINISDYGLRNLNLLLQKEKG